MAGKNFESTDRLNEKKLRIYFAKLKKREYTKSNPRQTKKVCK